MEMLNCKDVAVQFRKYQKRESFKNLVHHIMTRSPERTEKFFALNGITFSGVTGQIIGVVGSNGAGKTTLCRVLSRIYKPDAGTVDVRSEITAMLSLGAGFNNRLTGRENIYLNGMMLGFNRKKMKSLYNDIVEFSGIADFIDQPVKTYSSGMRARLGFSIASMISPEVMLLDEALTTGDLQFAKKAGDRISEMVKNARLVIVVTHSMEFVRQNCDYAIWINAGQIKMQGKPADVVAGYEKMVAEKKKNAPKRILHLANTVTEVKNAIVTEVTGLGINFDVKGKKFHALKNVSFKIKEGEIVGIIGHNGAGKSTLCKTLCQIYKPDQGNIVQNGKTSALLGFGIGFMKDLTGRENIYINGMLLGMSRKYISRFCDEIIEFSELGDAINKPVKYYSSGMYSRLGFSIAAFLQPDILVIDEALSAGDKSFTEKAAEKIQELITVSKAVIVVTHSMHFVRKVCTRGIVLQKGQLVFNGNAKDAVDWYVESRR
ncbi:MAG: ATP-binding cassette domain-containing protein [Spirochaetes bacterium]|nr:ATP-binding cassette domain-containing protein [Spirochaetota bacterium]